MGIDKYREESDSSPAFDVDNSADTVRPYVAVETHELIREFSKNAGIGITQSYDILLRAALNNQEVLETVLVESSITHYSDTTDIDGESGDLLKDIAEKCKELGCMPTREQVNSDDSMHGFAIYVSFLGDTENMRRLVEKHYNINLD